MLKKVPSLPSPYPMADLITWFDLCQSDHQRDHVGQLGRGPVPPPIQHRSTEFTLTQCALVKCLENLFGKLKNTALVLKVLS